MKVIKIEPIEKGNPFLSDLERMGKEIDNNIIVMFMKHSDNESIIVVDTRSGERLKILLNESDLDAV